MRVEALRFPGDTPIVRKAMRIFAVFISFSIVAAAFAPVHAQSLADVAKKEQDRRKTVQSGKARVYTNGDLPSAADSSPDVDAAKATSAGADATAAPGEKSTTEKADAKTDAKPDAKTGAKPDDKAPAPADKDSKGDVKDREYWNSRMQTLNQQLDRDRLYAEALQTRVNALTAEFAGRDDPAQRSLISEDREKALVELERLRKTIADDKDAIGALEDEARHAGVPPGWLR